MIFRAATLSDVADLVEVQAEGAIKALSHIFPQETHPFPRKRAWWRAGPERSRLRTSTPTSALTTSAGSSVSRRRGTRKPCPGLPAWRCGPGSGLARELHDAVLDALAETMRTGTASLEPASLGTTWVRLRVFEENHRARRFYAKLGWTETGRRTQDFLRIVSASSNTTAPSAEPSTIQTLLVRRSEGRSSIRAAAVVPVGHAR